MNRRSIVGVVAGLSLVLSGVAAAPAAMASKGCVTAQEFAKAKTGMTPAQITKLFGTKGKETTRSEILDTVLSIRSYKTCTQFGAVSISFQDGKLQSKTGIF